MTNIGQLSIEPIHDGTLYGAPSSLVPDATPLDWERHADLLAGDGQLEMAMGGFLVRGDADRIILIDTGFGADHPQCGQLTVSLRAVGVDPSDISDVVFTHLHQDHIGGIAESGVASFPNATYRCHVADWSYFNGPAVPENGAKPDAEKLAMLASRLEPWDSSSTLFPGIDVVDAPGHTPGSSLVVLSAQERRLMLLGDVVHCPAQLVEADWSTLFDVDHALALETRRRVIRELDDEATEAVGGHFPGLQFGRVLEGAGRRHFVFAAPVDHPGAVPGPASHAYS